MNSKAWIRKALTMCLVIATFATYSMVALASPERLVGELTVSGKTANEEIPAVKVNGEAAQSGRAIFSSSTVATADNASAIVNLGNIGKIELAPQTTITLSFDEKGLSGDLVAGKVTVLSSPENGVTIKTPTGNAKLNAGESAAAKQTNTGNSGGGGSAWYVAAAVIAAAAVGIIFTATTNNNDITLGGTTTVVSTSR